MNLAKTGRSHPRYLRVRAPVIKFRIIPGLPPSTSGTLGRSRTLVASDAVGFTDPSTGGGAGFVEKMPSDVGEVQTRLAARPDAKPVAPPGLLGNPAELARAPPRPR